MGLFCWIVRCFTVRVILGLLDRDDIGFENPGIPEKVRRLLSGRRYIG
jgi:hypothetical protein